MTKSSLIWFVREHDFLGWHKCQYCIGFQLLQSNYSQSMVIITEENVNVFNFDHVKVELTDSKGKWKGRKGVWVKNCDTIFTRNEEMLSLNDRIKNRNLSYSSKIKVTIKGNKHIWMTIVGERRMGKLGDSKYT